MNNNHYRTPYLHQNNRHLLHISNNDHYLYTYPTTSGTLFTHASSPSKTSWAPTINWKSSISIEHPSINIALSKDGHIMYVTTYGGNQVLKYTITGKFLSSAGPVISGTPIYPDGIAVSPLNNHVFITSTHNIVSLNENMTLIDTFGHSGSGPGKFSILTGIAIDDEGAIFVADSLNHCIQKFTSDFQFIRIIGEQGRDPGQFFYPEGIAINSRGDLIVCDSGHSRIQIFTNDGDFLFTFGYEGHDIRQSVAVDVQDNIYVTAKNRMQVFSPDGKPIKSYLFSEFGGIAISPSITSTKKGLVQTLVVCDKNNNRVLAADIILSSVALPRIPLREEPIY